MLIVTIIDKLDKSCWLVVFHSSLLPTFDPRFHISVGFNKHLAAFAIIQFGRISSILSLGTCPSLFYFSLYISFHEVMRNGEGNIFHITISDSNI